MGVEIGEALGSWIAWGRYPHSGINHEQVFAKAEEENQLLKADHTMPPRRDKPTLPLPTENMSKTNQLSRLSWKSLAKKFRASDWQLVPVRSCFIYKTAMGITLPRVTRLQQIRPQAGEPVTVGCSEFSCHRQRFQQTRKNLKKKPVKSCEDVTDAVHMR